MIITVQERKSWTNLIYCIDVKILNRELTTQKYSEKNMHQGFWECEDALKSDKL